MALCCRGAFGGASTPFIIELGGEMALRESGGARAGLPAFALLLGISWALRCCLLLLTIEHTTNIQDNGLVAGLAMQANHIKNYPCDSHLRRRSSGGTIVVGESYYYCLSRRATGERLVEPADTQGRTAAVAGADFEAVTASGWNSRD